MDTSRFFSCKKSLKLAKKAKKESATEEKNNENNTAASEIEQLQQLQQLQQLLDCEAKRLSDKQIYIGCFVSNVKTYIQDMIEMKGRDYAIDYMNEHWPKIDLSKVL